MKGLVWNAVKQELIKNSIWEKIDDEKIKILKTEFEAEFGKGKAGDRTSTILNLN